MQTQTLRFWSSDSKRHAEQRDVHSNTEPQNNIQLLVLNKYNLCFFKLHVRLKYFTSYCTEHDQFIQSGAFYIYAATNDCKRKKTGVRENRWVWKVKICYSHLQVWITNLYSSNPSILQFFFLFNCFSCVQVRAHTSDANSVISAATVKIWA